MCYYASVGGATRHTVVRLFVCSFVSQSVCYFSFAAHAERRALKLAMQVELDIISLFNI